MLGSIYKNSGPSKGGRPPYDAVLMFNLSDDQTKLQIRARYSFYCFPGLSPEGKVPDAKTVWVYRERLKEPGLVDKLFSELLIQIDAAGFSVRKGQIVDAAIVPAPRQHNTREENRQIKAGDSTEIWSDNKRRQKNVEAHWNHEVIRKYAITSAEVHDSQVFEERLDENNNGSVWVDSACRSRTGSRFTGVRITAVRFIASRHVNAPRMNGSKRQTENDQEFGLELSTCLLSRPIN